MTSAAAARLIADNGGCSESTCPIASARVTPGYLGNPDADRAAFPAGNWPAARDVASHS